MNRRNALKLLAGLPLLGFLKSEAVEAEPIEFPLPRLSNADIEKLKAGFDQEYVRPVLITDARIQYSVDGKTWRDLQANA